MFTQRFLASSFSAFAFLLVFVVLFTLKILFTLQRNLLIYKGLTALGSANATNCNMINLTDGPHFVIGSPKKPLFMKLKKKPAKCQVRGEGFQLDPRNVSVNSCSAKSPF
jgi:hypothetical protein